MVEEDKSLIIIWPGWEFKLGFKQDFKESDQQCMVVELRMQYCGEISLYVILIMINHYKTV